MKLLTLRTLILAVGFYSSTQAATFEKEDGLLFIDDENLSRNMNKFPYFMTMAFASWCSVCTTIAPEFKRAAKELAKLEPPVPLGVIDADKKTSGI